MVMDNNKPKREIKFRPTSLSIITVTPDVQARLEQLRRTNKIAFDNIQRIPDGYEEKDFENYDDDLDEHYSNEIIVEEEDCEDGKSIQIVCSKNPTVTLEHNGQNNKPKVGRFNSPLLRYVIPISHGNSNGDTISTASFHSESRRQLPSILKRINSKEDALSDNHDDHSIGDCSITNQSETLSVNVEHEENMNKLMNWRMFRLTSIIYAIVVVIVGLLVTISDMNEPVNDKDHLFNIIMTFIGMGFLMFIHYDVQSHKRFVMNWEKRRKEAIESPMKTNNADLDDQISITTAVIFNRTYDDEVDESTKIRLNSYKFLTGKHSGNFYLKIGMSLFCMGSIIHQGINFALQIHYYTQSINQCNNTISFIVYLVRCISAFYQLYIAFKYSNLIINRNHYVVMFGMMHLLATSIAFWFSTIVEEAMDGYTNKIQDYYKNSSDIPENIVFRISINHHINCSSQSFINFESMPLLYPFSIEYNIILASVWYIIWANIGSNDPLSQLHHIREEINQDETTGTIDITYRSNVTFHADCHASNMGLFGGLLSLLLVIITIIIFFSTIHNSQYEQIGIGLYTFQFGFLTVCCLVAVPLAFRHTRTLNVVNHHHLDNPATAMDDLLLLIPLPFFYVHHLLCIFSEIQHGSTNSIFMSILYIFHLIQVTIQTPFLVDGIRRCSNKRQLRFHKPGKGLITFAIIINIALWIMITFEIKLADKHHSMPSYFGKFVWMIILDTCLPLMLFYRFHSSVCLSDIWQHAYEKD